MLYRGNAIQSAELNRRGDEMRWWKVMMDGWEEEE